MIIPPSYSNREKKVCQWTNYFRYIDRSAAQPTSTAHLLHRGAAAATVRHRVRHLHRAAAAVLLRHRADHRGADHRHHHLGRVLHHRCHPPHHHHDQ